MESIQTTENFNKIIQSDQPVIIKFEAGWCPDCKAMDLWIDPIIENTMPINGIQSIEMS